MVVAELISQTLVAADAAKAAGLESTYDALMKIAKDLPTRRLDSIKDENTILYLSKKIYNPD